MMAYIQYFPETDTLGKVRTSWQGKPDVQDMVVYAMWPADGVVHVDRWYVYTVGRETRHISQDKVPEAVRLAYMLMQ